MKILHTSDWHLGALEAELSLEADQKHFIDEICSITDNNHIDVVIIAGDIYDKSIASAKAIELYDYAMTRLCNELNKLVIVIAGNHDNASRLSGCRELLKKSGLYVCGVLEDKPQIVSTKDVDFYLFPYFTEEKVKGLYPDKKDEIKCMTDAFKVVCDVAKASFDASKKHIAVAHAFITNASTSGSDRSAQIAAIGSALNVDAQVFDGFDYAALGHIHGPQDINEIVRYSGTPLVYSFGREEQQEKSVTIIDTDTMQRQLVRLNPLHRRTTLKGKYEKLLEGDYDEDIKNGYVRLDITDIYVGLEGIAALRCVYPNLLEINCKSFESENAQIRLTMDELRELEADPKSVFLSFCRDVYNEDADEHLVELFTECVMEDEAR